MSQNYELPPGFTYIVMGEMLLAILKNRHLNKEMILQIVRDRGGFGVDRNYAMTLVIQQMSLMLRQLDPVRMFPDGNRTEVEKVFKECLEELYSNAEPDEVNYWLDDVLPDDLQKELEKHPDGFDDDEARYGQEMASMRKDPLLQDFMKAFDDPEGFIARYQQAGKESASV